MADEDLDLDVKGGNKLNTMLLIVVIVLLLVVAGGGAAMFLMGGDESGEEGKGTENANVDPDKPQPKVAHYLELKPEFVVNLEDGSKAAYIQVEMQLMSRDKAVLSKVEEHMPVIRNDILTILGGQKYEPLSNREGKEKLRSDIVTAIHKALEIGEKDAGIESVYFTSLIMQ